jgi:hypothetical protein
MVRVRKALPNLPRISGGDRRIEDDEGRGRRAHALEAVHHPRVEAACHGRDRRRARACRGQGRKGNRSDRTKCEWGHAWFLAIKNHGNSSGVTLVRHLEKLSDSENVDPAHEFTEFKRMTPGG